RHTRWPRDWSSDVCSSDLFQNRFGTLRAYTKYTFDMTNVTEFDNVVNGFERTVLNGRLPSVTFIDPAFGDLPPGNDDAPPADLRSEEHTSELQSRGHLVCR